MSLDILRTVEIIETMENFVEWKRPPEEIRDKMDLSYKIENQSIIIFNIRPNWVRPTEKIESPIAKTTYVHRKRHWKIFWLRANLKWDSYDPIPTVKTIDEFLEIITEDQLGCFWG